MKLIIEDDEGHKTTVPFVRDEITVGREEGNTIRLTERNVSRRHARFFKQSGQIYVEDLKSFNGIKVNGDRIDGSMQLKEGDLIQIGDFDLAVQGEQAATLNGHTGGHPAGRAAQATEQMPALDVDVDTVNVAPGEGEVESDPSKPAMPRAGREATSVIRVPLQVPDGADGANVPAAGESAEVSGDEAPRLVIVSTELAGREFACIRTVLTLGRGDECDIVINHRSLSRAHCRLERERNGSWKVVDLGSSNRTQVNGEEYAESALHAGDIISLGHVKLRFCAPGEDYVYSANSDGGPKRNMVPIIAGAAIGAAALGSVLVYFVMQGKKKPAPPPDTVATSPATTGLIDSATPPEVKKPDVVAGTTSALVKPDTKPPDTKPETKPDVVALVPETKPDVKPPPEPKPDVKPPAEVKPAADSDEQKVNAAVTAAEIKLTKSKDVAGAQKILDSVVSISTGYVQYDAMAKRLQAERVNGSRVEDVEQKKTAAPTMETLDELKEIPPQSIYYARAQALVKRWEKQVKAAAAPPKGAPPPKGKGPKGNEPPAPVLQASAEDDKPKRALELRKEGTDKIRANDLEGALPLLKKAVEYDGNNPDNLRALAGCLARLNRFGEASVYYKRFLQVAPNDSSAPAIRQALSDYEASGGNK